MRTLLITLLLSLAPAAHGAPRERVAPVVQPTARAELAKQRALQLQRLREYRLAGRFASDDQGRPASVFRDSQGRLCPMAHLIAASGRMDLVDQVAREHNTLQLADVTDGPLWDWMLTSGLTRAEIIRIQGIARLGDDVEQAPPPVIERGPRSSPARRRPARRASPARRAPSGCAAR